MQLIREKIKKLLSPRALKSIRTLRSFYGEIKSDYQLFAFPFKKSIYGTIISVFPRRHWGYEKILGLIFQHRSYDLINHSKLFLHYFQLYRDVNQESILKWRIEVSISHLMLHDVENLQKTMQEFTNIQESIIKQKHLDVLGIRFIKGNTFQNYHAHAFMDTHVKSMLLGWTHGYKIVQLMPPGDHVPNPVMLEYWKQYIPVLDDEEVIQQLSPLKTLLELDTAMVATLRGKSVYIEHAKGIVQKEWEKQRRRPLFEFKSEDKEYGWAQLAKKGITKDTWFVSLHVRDPGYKTGSYRKKEEYDSYRNADIMTYELAIREVVKRGGYVIRVGDPNMKPFIAMDGFFDYALSDIWSNRMDIFLFSQCRFFIGTSSGPVLTPVLFGVPVVMTNYAPMTGRPHAGNCIFIPKLLWLKRENRYATFHEVLSSDLGRMFTSHGYEEKEVDILDNSPEELRDVVVEMLDRLDGVKIYSEEDENRQKTITELYQKYSGYGDLGRMGNAFINKYANLGML